ncbi:MAG: hypothetical protein WAW96_10285 [Alphaproteobacteria bacterium]
MSVAVVPLLADEIRMNSSNGFQSTESPRTIASWDTPTNAGKIVGELLAGTKTTVVPPRDLSGLLPSDANARDWAQQIWRRLRDSNRIGDSDVVLFIRQNAIDAMGRQYSPLPDFFALGLVGVAIGAATREDRFQPSFYVMVNEGSAGSSRCSIGFDTRLLDAKTGAVLSEANSVLGQEKLPDTFHPQSWEGMGEDDRRTAETYCIAALRRAISQAIRELKMTTQ